MLFSDWDGSGRRDLRVSNDRQYYDDERRARSSSGAIDARRAAAAVHRGRRLAAAAAVGDGHRQLRPDRRRLSRGLPHEPGRRTSSRRSPTGRPSPTYRDIALRRGVIARARSPAATRCRRPPGTPSSRTSTTTAASTCSCPRATWTPMPDYATRDPSNLFLGQPDGTFVDGADAAGIVRLRPRAAARRSRTSTLDGLLDLVEVVPAARRSGSGATSGPATPDAPAPMGNWLGDPAARGRPEPRRHRRQCVESQAGDVVDAPRAHGRRRARGRPAGLAATSGSERPARAPGPGDAGRTARSGRGSTSRRTSSSTSRAARPRRSRGRRRRARRDATMRRRADGDRRGWRRSTCPEFGLPDRATRAAAGGLRGAARPRCGRGRGRPGLRPPRRVRRPRAQREPRLADRVRPTLRGGDPGRRAGRARRRSSSATSAGAWPARRRSRCAGVLFQDLSLPSQPRDRSRPLGEILADEGIGPGSRVGVVGWKTYADRARIESRRSSSTSCAGSTGPRAGSSRTRPGCSSTPATACG